MEWQEKAEGRVNESPKLFAHRDILLLYDWHNIGEHMEWVATAPVEEILDWVWAVVDENRIYG